MCKARASLYACAGLLGFALLRPLPVAASWPADPLVNVPLSIADGNQGNSGWSTIIPDGAGGAIVAWHDRRGADLDIYAQRISANGTTQWTADGVALCTSGGEQSFAQIVPDGAGGAIITWRDHRSGNWDIYAQRISAAGTIQWTADGVALCTAAGSQQDGAITPDGAGGAIVTWADDGDVYQHSDIHAQRISGSGTVLWTADGVALCTAAHRQTDPTIVPDGAGGAIVAWFDDRSGDNDFDIYTQRVSAGGAVQWASDGVALCKAAGMQSYPNIVPDGAGGAIVAWLDSRAGGDAAFDVYAQRLSASGTIQWAADGVALLAGAGGLRAPAMQRPNIVPDGAGGAVVAWSDYRSGDYDVYAQRISSAGAVQWTVNGVAACAAASAQRYHAIDSDGAGGAIISWMDDRSGTDQDIYAQRISGAGTVEWAPDGVALCTAGGEQAFPSVVPDGAGGAIVAWTDSRGGNPDIYAQRALANGQLGGDTPALTPTGVTPPTDHSVRIANPVVSGNVDVSFAVPAGRSVRVDLLDLAGRIVASGFVAGGTGPQTFSLARSSDLVPGIYLVRVGLDKPVVARVAVLH